MALDRKVTEYIAGLRIAQGRHAGQRFKVLRWQARFLRGALAPGVSESSLSVGRGAGKSTLIAAIGCAALDGPLMEPNAEILIVASSHEQGQIIFRHILRFLDTIGESEKWRVSDTVNTSRVVNRGTGTMLTVKGSDPRRLHGAAPSLVICDEVAQWPGTKIDGMLSALRTSAGKIPGSRMLLIGTRPSDESHPFAVALRNAAYVQVHAAQMTDPPFRRTTWLKANPGLAHLTDLEAAIRREAKAARKDPALLQNFRALRLNLGVADVEAAYLIDVDLWETIEGEAGRSGPCIWGIDLGTSAAQSAVAGYWPETGLLECLAAFPLEPTLEERGLRDGVGRLYRDMAKRGELHQFGQRATSIADLLGLALDRLGKPFLVVADRFREAELRDALDGAGIPPAGLETRGMGFIDGAADVRAFRRACAEGKVTPRPSLLLRSGVSEARTVSDPAGNAKLAKNAQGGRRLRARDDAAAAAILAVAAGVRVSAHAPRSRGMYMGQI